MRTDWYLRGVLTVIAGALVYIGVLLTPLPAVSAQGTRVPGPIAGPLEVVIVGSRLSPDTALPVQVARPVTVTGEVRVTNDLRITGRVQTEQVPQTTERVVLAGWEEVGSPTIPGRFTPWIGDRGQGLPVSSR